MEMITQIMIKEYNKYNNKTSKEKNRGNDNSSLSKNHRSEGSHDHKRDKQDRKSSHFASHAADCGSEPIDLNPSPKRRGSCLRNKQVFAKKYKLTILLGIHQSRLT